MEGLVKVGAGKHAPFRASANKWQDQRYLGVDVLRSALDAEKPSAKPLALLPMNENGAEGMIGSREVSVDRPAACG